MNNPYPVVTIELWRADAIVLFDWLMTVDFNTIPIAHPSQKQALVDLLNRFDQDTDVVEATEGEIEQAQAQVGANMGW